MQLNKNSFSSNKGLPNDIFKEKIINNKKKINSLKIEFQEPKEETMHLLSPNKSDRKILDDDIYKTEMNNKKPIDIFQDISIDNQENNKNDEIKKNRNDLQYLIEKNKTERIDFISTLLRLKGIKIDEDKYYDKNNKKENSELNIQINNNTNNTNSIAGGQSNISTNISKINSENKLINNDSLNEQNSNIRKYNIYENMKEYNIQSYNYNKNNIINYIIYNNNKTNSINNSKRLIRFCSSMIRNKKKPKLYYTSKSTNKKNKYINFDFKEGKVNHFLNIFNKVTIQNNNIIINNINEKGKIKYIPNINDKKYATLCHNKSSLIKKIPINIKKNNKYNKKGNNSSSKCKKTKICFEETIPHPKFNKSHYRHKSALYKNRTKPIIQKEKSQIEKNIKNLSNISNNSINKIGKIIHLRSFSQSKNKPIKSYNFINIIKKTFSTPFNNLNNKIIDLKHNNNICLKKQFYIKEKIKNNQGLFTTKSNLLHFRNDSDFANTFRLNLKQIKKIINIGNELKIMKSSKINKNLYESNLEKNKVHKNENEIFQKSNNYNFDIDNNKEKSKEYINIELKDNINNTDFINNEKKNIILSIEINKKCFS